RQACNDRAVGAAQADPRDMRARTAPGFAAGRDDLLTEHGHPPGIDGFDRPDRLADHIDAACRPAIALALRHDARELPDPQRLHGGCFAIDGDGHVRRESDALPIDEDAAEALDHADNSGAADAVVIAAGHAPAADALIPA